MLVVAPLRVCNTVWKQEVSKWSYDFKVRNLCQRVKKGLKQERDSFMDLLNYESLKHLEDHAHLYDMIVFDESTYVKNFTAKRTKSARKLVSKVLRRLVLTGTPAPNSLMDLFAQVYMIDRGASLGKNLTVFRSLFCAQGGWQGREWKMREGQAKKLKDAVAPLVRQLDAASNLPDLPELSYVDMICQLPPACIAGYKKLKKELLIQLESGNLLLMANAASAYAKCRQYASGQVYDEDRNVHVVHKEKLKMLGDLVEQLGGQNLIIFHEFTHESEAICKHFKQKIPILNGATKAKDAQQMIDDWNARKLPLFLIQSRAGSHGLNLQQGGSNVCFYGLPQSLETYEQAYRRVFRQGNKESHVYVYRLLTQSTVDEIINTRLKQKDMSQREFLDLLKEHARSTTI